MRLRTTFADVDITRNANIVREIAEDNLEKTRTKPFKEFAFAKKYSTATPACERGQLLADALSLPLASMILQIHKLQQERARTHTHTHTQHVPNV